MSFSACSGPVRPGSVTRCAGTSRSPAGAHTPDVPGNHPDTLTPSASGRALARPPDDGSSPIQEAKLDPRAFSRTQATSQPKLRCRRAGPAAFAASPGESTGGPPRIAARPSTGWVDDIPGSPPEIPRTSHEMRPCRCRASSVSCRLVSEAHGSFAGCLADIPGARPLPESCLSFGRSVPPDPSCSVHVVRSPPRRLAPRAGSQAIAPGTGMTSLVSTPRTRRPPRWLPSEMPGEGRARLSRSVAFTPLEEPASRALTRSGREPWTRRTASPRPLPPCRFS